MATDARRQAANASASARFAAMLALADIADDEGHVIYARGAKRAQTALAKKARMSVATFRRATAALYEAGLLEASRETQHSENECRVLLTAQDERSDLSGQNIEFERSHGSQVSGHTSRLTQTCRKSLTRLSETT